MNYLKMNGLSFDVDVALGSVEESFNVLDGSNAGRVLSGKMQRDVIGTFIGHKVTLFSKGDDIAFDALWSYLVAHSVDDFVLLEAADNQSSISYEAYYTAGKRKLRSAERDTANHWDEIEINFVPIDPQVKP